jgi:hypothetical protein
MKADCVADNDFANRLPAGATGTAAIYTGHVKVAHVIPGSALILPPCCVHVPAG